jgi:hypothetical protein
MLERIFENRISIYFKMRSVQNNARFGKMAVFGSTNEVSTKNIRGISYTSKGQSDNFEPNQFFVRYPSPIPRFQKNKATVLNSRPWASQLLTGVITYHS